MPGYGNFQSVPRYRKGTDQKPPIIRHYLIPYTPFAIQILNPLDIRFTKTPVPGAKMHPRNAWRQILFKFWAIVGHSVPPYYNVFRKKACLCFLSDFAANPDAELFVVP